MINAAYIHIPFCEHICHYCDFNKVFIKNQPVKTYLEALEKEIHCAEKTGQLQTLFVGGGTPTALGESDFEWFISMIKRELWSENIKEFTVEANPENLTSKKLVTMKENGVNRLSIGVQAFQNDLLFEIGRPHKKEDIAKSIIEARKSGFDNISLDLMFGLPNQTKDMLGQSIDDALSLNPEHISIYSLQVEPKTIFFNRLKKGTLPLPSQDIEAEMYEMIINRLSAAGYQQYEISNFAKPGKESLHNLKYWDNAPYFGFGAGAHGYVDGSRVVNAGPVNKYIEKVDKSGSARTASHPVTQLEEIEEEMFLGLRKLQGISLNDFYHKFGKTVHDIYGKEITRLIGDGLLKETNHRLFLTRKGIFLGNEVFEAFIHIT